MAATRRLFVAVSPSEPVRRRVAAVGEALRQAAGRAGAELRWVAPENVHVTLQFLGAVAAERVPEVEAAVRAAAAAGRPLALEVTGVGGFPSARRPRVVWLGLGGETPGLAALAAELGRRLARLGFEPEARPFSPHLTLARARDPRGLPGLGRALAAFVAAEPVPWRVADVALVESHLSPRGPRYEDVLRARLGGPGGAPA